MFLSNITVTPLSLCFRPEYITQYPSLSKSRSSVHLTSLTPTTFKLFFFISTFKFSNFPLQFIVLTFHVPIFISCVLTACFLQLRCRPSSLAPSAPGCPEGFNPGPSSHLNLLVVQPRSFPVAV